MYRACPKSTYSALPDDYNWYVLSHSDLITSWALEWLFCVRIREIAQFPDLLVEVKSVILVNASHLSHSSKYNYRNGKPVTLMFLGMHFQDSSPMAMLGKAGERFCPAILVFVEKKRKETKLFIWWMVETWEL